ncbi:SIR2-like protein [Luteibacter rhizovicinus]|uniref:SIR2-like protein n=1 Tax=Luteibacter rhizovicinus TaxID=242606 RepID=A0A4R3YL25_9GAMM|nr:SIR2 family protein [Luteibacter rhizovicinus]TCV92118.1 SIR2-like protein [Luteibacter rhizovicinus]
MTKRLYPKSPSSATFDPLRLAEEFRAYFGQSALDDFIRASIPDDSWYPGEVHNRLLELPWSDVLTTNWDTLLERSARSVLTHNYDVVHAATDLAHTRSPRIVKLHGTINGREPYTFTEEDYRTYPARNAAMVNFARQVFIENELCLVGFSGDDPNFLQWSGWVRDHLATSSRRIYLVGVLGLAPASRKLLESRNVAPIDLGPLVEHLPARDQHAAANELFVTHLENSRLPASHEWAVKVTVQDTFIPAAEAELRKSPEYAHAKLLGAYVDLRAEREGYPGWLICPSSQRRQLGYQINGIEERIRVAQPKLTSEEIVELAADLAWRYEASLGTLSRFACEFLANTVLTQDMSSLPRSAHRSLLSTLLRDSRERGNFEAFEKWAAILRTLGRHDRDALAELAYQQCLRLRDGMELEALETSLDAIEGADPVWLLRKASLLATLCRWTDAEALLRKALDDIRERTANARDSIWLRSRRTWGQWLLSATLFVSKDTRRDADFSRDTAYHCNPWDEIQTLRSEVESAVRDRASRSATIVTPLFSPGAYRDNSNTIHFRSAPVDAPLRTLVRFMESVGMPAASRRVNFVDFFADALSLAEPETLQWYSQVLQYTTDDKKTVVNSHLGRISIARMDASLVNALYASILRSIDYWRQRTVRRSEDELRAPAEELTKLIALLFRITPRLNSEDASRCFDLAMKLALEVTSDRDKFIKTTSDLITHAAKAMSKDARKDACLKAFEFPVDGEHAAATRDDDWPDPFEALEVDDLMPIRLNDPERWSARVSNLLKLSTIEGQRRRAVGRLTSMCLAGELTSLECETFGEAIWGLTTPVFGLPASTSLHAAVYMRLPHPRAIEPLALLRRWLFGDLAATARDKHRLAAVGFAAHERWGSIRPTPSEAQSLIVEILSDARTVANDDSLAAAFSSSKDRVQRFSGIALAMSALPATREITTQLFSELLSAIEEIPLPAAMAGLPYLANSSRSESIVTSIQRGLFGTNFAQVASAADAIWTWAKLGKSRAREKVPARLIDSLLLVLESRLSIGLSAVMHACRLLLEGGHLDKPSKLKVAGAVAAIAREYSYESIDPLDRRAVSASMIREECVRLALTLNLEPEHGFLYDWLKESVNDPLPEVRRAAGSL